MSYFFFSCDGDHRDLHVLTHSFQTRRSAELLPVGAVAAAAVGAVLEPTLLRPFYKRPEEYQLLVTFGLLKIGRAHVCTPVTNAPLVCRLLLDHTHAVVCFKNHQHRRTTG